MAIRATHFGECQLCGNHQKLPGDKLSLHGYDVQWGFFNGVCPGSKEEPYERSKDLIEGAIENAKQSLERLKKYVAELKQPATEAKGWRKGYVGGDEGYRWMFLPIEKGEGNKLQVRFEATSGRGYHRQKGERVEVVNSSVPINDPLLMATHMNEDYADELMRGKGRELAHYIDWQTKRLNDWKLKPLAPVTASGLPPAKEAERNARKASRALSAELSQTKDAFGKLSNNWSSEFLKQRERMRQTNLNDVTFQEFYYAFPNVATVFGLAKRFYASKRVPDDVKNAMRPMLDQMLALATKVKELKAAKAAG